MEMIPVGDEKYWSTAAAYSARCGLLLHSSVVCLLVISIISINCTKTDEPVEMLFAM